MWCGMNTVDLKVLNNIYFFIFLIFNARAFNGCCLHNTTISLRLYSRFNSLIQECLGKHK